MDVAVIGAGPAGLMAAEVLAQGGAAVTVYDAMPSAGRKFLMAGRGGLNLTHSEPLPAFLARYREAAPCLEPAISAFPPETLREWSAALGQPTYVGSSGRVFPESFKASPLLRAWLRRLDSQGVRFAFRYRWGGWDAQGRLRFQTPDGERVDKARATILALGGASWPRLGSDGAWVEALVAKGVAISPLRPANCGFTVGWSAIFRDRFEGQPLKGDEFKFGSQVIRGEAIITRTGIEGGPIYALSAELRETILKSGDATLHVALLPDLRPDELAARLSVSRGKQSISNFLRKTAIDQVGLDGRIGGHVAAGAQEDVHDLLVGACPLLDFLGRHLRIGPQPLPGGIFNFKSPAIILRKKCNSAKVCVSAGTKLVFRSVCWMRRIVKQTQSRSRLSKSGVEISAIKR